MRNKYAGTCYRCGLRVDPGDGHFELFRGAFRVQHATCAIQYRGTPDPERDADRQRKLRNLAAGTGKSAQRARRILRKEYGDAQ